MNDQLRKRKLREVLLIIEAIPNSVDLVRSEKRGDIELIKTLVELKQGGKIWKADAPTPDEIAEGVRIFCEVVDDVTALENQMRVDWDEQLDLARPRGGRR